MRAYVATSIARIQLENRLKNTTSFGVLAVERREKSALPAMRWESRRGEAQQRQQREIASESCVHSRQKYFSISLYAEGNDECVIHVKGERKEGENEAQQRTQALGELLSKANCLPKR